MSVAIEGIRPLSIVKMTKDNIVNIVRVEYVCRKKDGTVLVVSDRRGNVYEADIRDCTLHRAGLNSVYYTVDGEEVGKYGIFAY